MDTTLKNTERQKIYSLVLSLTTLFIPIKTYASELENSDANTSTSTLTFSVKPQKCIALHRGQVCYQKLEFNWYISSAGNYCLYQTTKEEPLYCWKNSGTGQFTFDFQSNQSESYQIRSLAQSEDLEPLDKQDQVLRVLKVKLATVYKQTKQSYSGWRLF